MKSVILSLSFALAHLVAHGQDARLQLKTQAQDCANAVAKGDYKTMTNYMHPRLLEMMGGRNAAVALTEKVVKAQLNNGVSITGASIEELGAVKLIGKSTTSIIKENVVLQVPEGTVDQTSYLLAISEDQGKSWVFIDLGHMTPELLRKIVPEIADGVTIPAKRDPILRKK